ncbi:MAG: ROK family protein [Acutalibacter sp.]
MKVYAGMDIGGTKVALGVFGEDKTLLGKTKYPSDASLSAEEFFQQAAAQLRALLGRLALPEEDLAGIGVGLPCMVRYPAGEVVLCAMLPALNGFGVKACLEGLFPGVQVAVDNDAHCAALAESRHGAGKGRQHMLYAR